MNKVISPCGLDCFNCKVYKDNVTPELQEILTADTPFAAADISCEGCTREHLCISLELQGKDCKTRDCAHSKNISYCFECSDFPCPLLMPTADGAATFPHNTKLYNLCLMQKLGVEQWSEIAADINSKYFNTSFEIGKGTAE